MDRRDGEGGWQTRLGNKQESVVDRAGSGRANSRSVRESVLLLLFACERGLWLQATGKKMSEMGERRQRQGYRCSPHAS